MKKKHFLKTVSKCQMPDVHAGSSSCFPLPLEHRVDTPMRNKSKCRNKILYTAQWQWCGERMCIRTKTWRYGAFSWVDGLGDIYHFVDCLLKNIRPAIRTQTCLWASMSLGFLSCGAEKINSCSRSCREATHEQQQRLGCNCSMRWEQESLLSHCVPRVGIWAQGEKHMCRARTCGQHPHHWQAGPTWGTEGASSIWTCFKGGS